MSEQYLHDAPSKLKIEIRRTEAEREGLEQSASEVQSMGFRPVPKQAFRIM